VSPGRGPGEKPGRPPEEAADDPATNGLGFRDVDEGSDHGESPGSRPAPGDEGAS
jgi:hypothetical protein